MNGSRQRSRYDRITEPVSYSQNSAVRSDGLSVSILSRARGNSRKGRQSGLTYTILRPTGFMEIWLGPHLGFDFANAKATIYGSGENKVSYISLHNVADFAVESVSNPAAQNAVLELGGPHAFSQFEVVRIFEEVSGRTFEKQFVSEEALKARKTAATNSVERTFADLTLAAARGDMIDMRETFKKFSVHPRSVREYAGTVMST